MSISKYGGFFDNGVEITACNAFSAVEDDKEGSWDNLTKIKMDHLIFPLYFS